MTEKAIGVAAASWTAKPWLGSDTLSGLAALNEQALGLLTEQAASCSLEPAHPLLREFAQLKLDAASLKRAAGCPYLLLDVGFADPWRWMWAQGHQVLERQRGPTVPFFTVPRASPVMRKVLTYGWHLAQSRQVAARVLLGMSAPCVELVGGCSLTRLDELADQQPAWLRPRWPHNIQMWREFLLSAATGDGRSLQQARLWGIQLLAADARAGEAG